LNFLNKGNSENFGELRGQRECGNIEGFRNGELQRKWGKLGSRKLQEQGSFGSLGKYRTWEILPLGKYRTWEILGSWVL
jgi:hypothetical protein